MAKTDTTHEDTTDYDVDAILGKSLTDIKAPQSLPMGTWRLRVNSFKVKARKANGNNAPVAEAQWMLTPVEAGDDVADAGDDFSVYIASHRIPLWSAADEYKIVRALNIMGIDESNYATLGEAGEASKGCEFFARVDHKHNETNPDSPYVNLSELSPVD